MLEFNVKYVDIDSIKPYPNNPRLNSDAIKEVAESLKNYGWRQPIVVDSDNVIVVGHTRHLAAKSLGYTEVPVHVANDLTPDEVKAYRIIDNATNEMAAWDLSKLQVELDDLEVSGESWDRLDDYISDFLNFGKTSQTPTSTPTGNTSKSFAPQDDDELLELRGNSFYDGADGGRETTTPIRYLTVGKKQIPLTQEEEERLLTAINAYGDEAGTFFGFVSSLLSGKYSNV